MERTCQICHCTFSVPPSILKRPEGGKYCSRKCYGASRSAKPRKVATVTCERCGADFEVNTCHIASGRRRFCSKKCVAPAQRMCENCGKAPVARRVKYCKECLHIKKSGPNAHNWKGGPKKAKCLACGKDYLVHPSCLGVVCSKSCWGAIAAKRIHNHGGKRGSGGRRPDLGESYFRSRWEANYARYLNLLIARGDIVRWEFEPDVCKFPVKRGNKHYTPDFKVFLPDGTWEYHEVKGWMDKASQIKLKRMAIHYKDIKVVLVGKDQYRAIARDFAHIIPTWERNKKNGIV